MFQSETWRSAIAVFGPTCVGKTALGIDIAREIDGEILSIDSLQCYRDGAIVTAQPSKEEQASVPHHLVGYLDAQDEAHFDFTDRARSVLVDLDRRHKTPVLVGGSTSLLLPVLLDMVDQGYKILVLILQPPVEGTLYADRIRSRVDVMIEQGMLDEIRGLHKHALELGLQEPTSGVWKTIGYPELRPFITSTEDDPSQDILLRKGLEELCFNSVKYGQHQLDWADETLRPHLTKEGVRFQTIQVPDFSRHTIQSIRSVTVDSVTDFVAGDQSGELYSKLATLGCDVGPREKFLHDSPIFPPTDAGSISSQSIHSDTQSFMSEPSKCDLDSDNTSAFLDSDSTSAFVIDSGSATPQITKMAMANRAEMQPKAESQQRVICVFAGSSTGSSPEHADIARSLAHAFHHQNVKLIYGGGTTGLMGVLASTLVSLSGPTSVHGIVPLALAQYEAAATGKSMDEWEQSDFGKRTIVPDMHTRKKMMADCVSAGPEGSGFIALSGGYGTLEELFEMITWKQLGIHNASVCVLNSAGFYDGLYAWMQKSIIGDGFVKGEDSDILEVATTADEALQKLYAQKLVGRSDLLKWT